ncbi:purine and uridine phosphorylase [Flagelloscypha sp. PMI_526]|nr:purine and uridine phosphorylase [Flagelloscypha sp. PMI_526]
MKDVLTNANFPRTADQRVYHLGLRAGEVANRIITVGSPSRAHRIASILDVKPKPFELSSERGFLTITGRYKGVPISILSIGMGFPNMDFFVREVRECIAGDLAIVRIGSCGGLVDVPVGSVTVPKACIAVARNVDFDFGLDENSDPQATSNVPYTISKPVNADEQLHSAVLASVQLNKISSDVVVLDDAVNASADSFYSSQGRQTSFADHNSDLIDKVIASTPNVKTLEMETHHLYHLAAIWARPPRTSIASSGAAPISAGPVNPSTSPQLSSLSGNSSVRLADPSSVIRAAAVQIIFASRLTQDFITPEAVGIAEEWTGKAVLDALVGFHIDSKSLHPEEGSVWQI